MDGRCKYIILSVYDVSYISGLYCLNGSGFTRLFVLFDRQMPFCFVLVNPLLVTRREKIVKFQ
jgi:hypothetical protein